MAKIFDVLIPAPIPGRAYAEIESDMVRYGFAPAGIELSLFEFPVTTIYNDKEVWLIGDTTLGLRFAFKNVIDNCATVKLHLFFPKPDTNRKTIWEKRVCW